MISLKQVPKKCGTKTFGRFDLVPIMLGQNYTATPSKIMLIHFDINIIYIYVCVYVCMYVCMHACMDVGR